MTDINQDNQVQNTDPAGDNVEVTRETTQEKMVPQSRVDHYVQDAWYRGYNKATGEREKQQQMQQSNVQQNNHEDFDAKLEAKLNEKLKAIQDKAVKDQQEMQMQSIANDFAQKIPNARVKYQDFDQKLDQIGGFNSISHLIPAINALDNAPDIVYELANNPSKIGNITQLAHINPQLALAELHKLSQSLKRNDEAKSQRYPDEPLSQLNHSNTGKDSGSNTISDFKKADWLRG